MQKLLFLLVTVVFASIILADLAHAVPDIRGEFSGTYSIVVSNCQDSDNNDTYNANLSMIILTQTGSIFRGSAKGTFRFGGMPYTEHIELDGTIDETGKISGTTTHIFLGTAGEGTFTGQLTGDDLTILNIGQDTAGDTCTYVRNMQATRIAYSIFNSYKLTPHADSEFLMFGSNVSISGDKAMVSCKPQGLNNIAPYGAVWFFELNGSIWEQTAFIPSDIYGDVFGYYAIGISGDYAIVGARYDKYGNSAYRGIVYVYQRKNSGWVKVADLTQPEGEAAPHFGSFAFISGKYVFVLGGTDAIYIFERGASGWTQVDKLTVDDSQFVSQFSISGDYALIKGMEAQTRLPFYFVFQRSGSKWIKKYKIDLDVQSNTSSISSDGYIIIGAPYDYDFGEGVGAAYLFEKSGNEWIQVEKLAPERPILRDMFGFHVSVSGNIAIIGSGSGTFVYKRINNRWKLIAKPVKLGGISAISGQYAIFGNASDDERGYYSGAAYIYDLSPIMNSAIKKMAMPWVPTLLLDD